MSPDNLHQDNTEFHAAIAGAVAGAYHARAVAEQYGVPVILHTDHCAKLLGPKKRGENCRKPTNFKGRHQV